MPLTQQEQEELDHLEAMDSGETQDQSDSEKKQGRAPIEKIVNPYKDISKSGSALHGAGQMATVAWGDEIASGIGAAADVAGAAMGQRGDISFKDAYRTRKNQSDMLNEASAEQNPGSYFTGGVAGSAMLGAVAPVANPATYKGAAALGTLYGAGATKENIIDNPVGVAGDVAYGGAGGVAGKYLGDKVGNLYKALRQKGKDKAIDELFRRKSGMAEDVLRFKKEGNLGTALTEKGPNGERPIVSGIRRGSDMMEPIEERLGQYGEKLATARHDVDAYNLGQGSGDAIVRELRNLDIMKSDFPGDQATKDQVYAAMNYFKGRNDISMEDLQRLKEVSFNWKKISPAQQTEKGQDLVNQMNKIVSNEQRNVAGRGAEMTAIPEMEQNLRDYPTNQGRASALISAKEAALKEGGKDIANRGASITDYMSGLGGASIGASTYAASGNPTLAAAAAITLGLSATAINKFLRERGNTVASRAFIQLANALDNQGVSAKYMPLIKAAARRGPEALAILHMSLKQKDPEYENQFVGGQQ